MFQDQNGLKTAGTFFNASKHLVGLKIGLEDLRWNFIACTGRDRVIRAGLKLEKLEVISQGSSVCPKQRCYGFPAIFCRFCHFFYLFILIVVVWRS